jgi:hypothetical protein
VYGQSYAMGRIHEQLELNGRQGALALTSSGAERRVLDAAFDFMSDADPRTGFLFSGWCQTALPHKRLDDDAIWQHETDYVRLLIEPGSVSTPLGPRRIGVPYGSRARLILLFLQTEAIKTNSREIELGKSLRDWLRKLAVPVGGRSLNEVREQAARISRCRMTFEIARGRQVGLINQNIVDTAMFTHEDDGAALLEVVRLSDSFFNELKRHPVPIQESAVRAIANNSQALDIYCWLAYRLHILEAPCLITWAALRAQFGSSYASIRAFRQRFLESLAIAMAVYPEAKVDISPVGVKLLPCPPPVPFRGGVSKARGRPALSRTGAT